MRWRCCWLGSCLRLPLFLCFLSRDTSRTQEFGIQQQKFEHQGESKLPQIYADMVGWEKRVKIVAAYFHSLPPEEQKVTAIGASNYGEAGAVDLFGPKYGLPKAISTANNYWISGPRTYTGESLILMDEASPEKYARHWNCSRWLRVPMIPTHVLTKTTRSIIALD